MNPIKILTWNSPSGEKYCWPGPPHRSCIMAQHLGKNVHMPMAAMENCGIKDPDKYDEAIRKFDAMDGMIDELRFIAELAIELGHSLEFVDSNGENLNKVPDWSVGVNE